MRWIGHVARIPNKRPVKVILYGELAEGSKRVDRLLIRYKDTIKDILRRGGALDMWIEIVGDRSAWWRFTSDV